MYPGKGPKVSAPAMFLTRWLGFVEGAAMIILGLTINSIALGARPVVSRIEPPNWWVGHSHNPVRLLMSGEGLADVRVEAPDGFRVSSVRHSADGHYLFVDLGIPADQKPGAVPLKLVSGDGVVNVAFKLLAHPGDRNRYRGVTADDVIYLIVLDRFANGDPSNDDPVISRGLYDRKHRRRYHGGDLQGVIDHLDYLKALGVTTLWLTPWYDNVNHFNYAQKFALPDSRVPEPSADYHGYGVVDFYGTEEHLGDLSLLRKLVERAHDAGLKVMQDQVVNLTSPHHPWVTNPPTPTWFNGTLANHLTNSFQTWAMTVTNPPPDQLKNTVEGWFFGVLPDLNQNDPEVAQYLIQNSLWWVAMTDVDAARQDALPFVPRQYWTRWSAILKREHPGLTVLGEMWDIEPRRVAFFQGGKTRFDGVDSGMDGLFDFPMHYAIRNVFCGGQPMSRLTEIIEQDAQYVDATKLVTFLGLHDQPRFMSEPGATSDGLKLAFTFIFTTRGIPLIYYGDEIGMRGEADPENRRDFPGGWPEDAQNAFRASNRTPEQASVYDHIARLLRLRTEVPSLRTGKLVNLAVNADTYAFARVASTNSAILLFNNSVRRQHLEVPLAGVLPNDILLTDRLGDLGKVKTADGKLRVLLLPRAAAVLTL